MQAGEDNPLAPGADLAALLAACGVQPTPQRRRIAEILFARPQHLTADEIFNAANTGGARVSRATVYNTLKLLVERKLVRQVMIEPSRIFYDSNTRDHHHIYNEDTGRLSDVPAGQVRFAEMPPLPADTVESEVEVILRVRSRKS